MKVLAVEISSDAGSLALVEDGGVVASVPMDARQRRSQGLFDAGGALVPSQLVGGRVPIQVCG